MLNIVLIGPQGAGKGTQSVILTKQLPIPVLSLGQLLRAETDRETGLGRDIARYIKDGERVPDDIIYHLIYDRLSEQDTDAGVIIDGYPRSVDQAETLDDIMTKLDRQVTHAFYIDISDEEAIRRLTGRRVCSNSRCGANYHVEFMPPKGDPETCDVCGKPLKVRDDDNPEAIKRRLEIFHKDTAPLADFYSRRGLLHRFNGGQPIKEVNSAMLTVLGVDIASVVAPSLSPTPVMENTTSTSSDAVNPATTS
jgi:adenylate kinase